MSSISTYEMPDGRLVKVDFTSVKSVMKVKKKDWLVIQTIIKAQLEFLRSPSYEILFRENLKQLGFL